MAYGCERVRVIHVCSAANLAYQRSLYGPAFLALGATVSDVWSALLRQKDRFMSLDPEAFLYPAVTSDEYVLRYGAQG
jgi:hypothetical protein